MFVDVDQATVAADDVSSPKKRSAMQPEETKIAKRITRAQAEKARRWGRHICICPKGENCVSKHALHLPKNDDERVAWIEALGSKFKGKEGRVSATHWPERALKYTSNGKLKRAVKSILPTQETVVHDEDVLEGWSDYWNSFEDKCVCGLSEEQCGASITEFYKRPSSDAIAKDWLSNLRVNVTLSEEASDAELLDAFVPFKVAKRHFKPEDIQPFVNPYPYKTALPTFRHHAPEKLTRPLRRGPLSSAEREARVVLGHNRIDEDVVAVVASIIKERDEVAQAFEAEVEFGEQEKSQILADFSAIRRLMYESFKKSDEHCWRSLGERSWDLLVKKFEYLNATGALDRLAWWRSQKVAAESDKGATSKQGRDRALSTFDAYVLYKLQLKEGHSATLELMFGISEATARRNYITLLKACTTIMSHHLERPPLEAVCQAVPVAMRAELGLVEDTALYISDATERQTLSPRNPFLHGILYSQYKSRTTLKYNGVCLGNGFLVEFTKGYGGSTSDNKIMEVDGVGERLAMDYSYPLAILYDKGFTQFHHLERHGFMVLTPRAKEVNQLYYDHQADYNKQVARNRVFIEVAYGNCRSFDAFSKIINLDAIDIADLEAEAVRCEINLWPVMHSWTLTAAVATERAAAELAEATSRQDAREKQYVANVATKKGIEAKSKQRAEKRKKKAEVALAEAMEEEDEEEAGAEVMMPSPMEVRDTQDEPEPAVVSKRKKPRVSITPTGGTASVARRAEPFVSPRARHPEAVNTTPAPVTIGGDKSTTGKRRGGHAAVQHAAVHLKHSGDKHAKVTPSSPRGTVTTPELQPRGKSRKRLQFSSPAAPATFSAPMLDDEREKGAGRGKRTRKGRKR